MVFVAILLGSGLCLAGSTNDVSPATSRPAHWAVRLERPGVPNLHQVTTNLYRGAQPTAKGMDELKKLGIKTVVNLRHFHSDADELSGIGLKQGRLHLDPWRTRDEDIIRFLKIATDTNNVPVYVHCQRGADRTGLVCAMYRIAVCGWTKDEAIKELKEGGFGYFSGWKNIVKYIEKADIEQIRKRAGLGGP
jgi:protein tyrosine/serine phosphatase